MIFYGIQNFTMGIADPHVFDVPTICPKVGPPQQVRNHFSWSKMAREFGQKSTQKFVISIYVNVN